MLFRYYVKRNPARDREAPLKMILLPSDIVHENPKIREMRLSVAEHVIFFGRFMYREHVLAFCGIVQDSFVGTMLQYKTRSSPDQLDCEVAQSPISLHWRLRGTSSCCADLSRPLLLVTAETPHTRPPPLRGSAVGP